MYDTQMATYLIELRRDDMVPPMAFLPTTITPTMARGTAKRLTRTGNPKPTHFSSLNLYMNTYFRCMPSAVANSHVSLFMLLQVKHMSIANICELIGF